jgi:hypothetical protein
MKEFGKLIPEKIKMLHFSIINGQIDCPEEHENKKVENFKFDVDFEMSHNLAENLVKTDFKVSVETESTDQKEAVGKFHFIYWFSVENLDELILIEEKEELVSRTLAGALSAITYSTSRGILMTRFQGTALSNFILPIVDPNDLLK